MAEEVLTNRYHHSLEELDRKVTASEVACGAAWLAAWGAVCNHKRSCSRSANLHRLEVGQPFPFPLMIEDSVGEADKEAQK